MNFFQSQDNARSNTKKLVLLFALAVICLILLTNLFLLGIFTYLEGSVLTMQSFSERFDLELFVKVGVAVTAVIAIASIYKVISLAGGGSKIMSYMDAEIIIHDSGDNDKQKILNVVEEMAIASGTPVPQVYLLNEQGINAFAAGTTIRDAAIGVTRGAIEQLSRDQLQGVIAHEFSHILNGDMRLNLRLIGILHGIMVVGLIGEFFLYSNRYRSSSKNNTVGLGLGLMVIGYAGTFFGKWIKAAVSRQREFLADASAVQFTRNPDGIAGALIKIGGYDAGSLIENSHGSEISHALFCEGATSYLKSLFATHPPLATRIKRILPSWDGSFEASESSIDSKNADSKEYATVSGFAAATPVSIDEQIINTVGRPELQNLELAQSLIHDLPKELYHAAHEAYGARAVIYFLLLASDKDMRQKQLSYCEENSDDGVYLELNKLVEKLGTVDINYRLAIIDIALPALAQLSTRQETLFLTNLIALVKMDSKISIFEWVLHKIVSENINNKRQKLTMKDKTYSSLKHLKNECSVVLSMLVYIDADSDCNIKDVFSNIKSSLQFDVMLMDKKDVNLKSFDLALTKLKYLKPLLKPQLLKACAVAINADRKITAMQLELYRAISVIVDCPMPPISSHIFN